MKKILVIGLMIGLGNAAYAGDYQEKKTIKNQQYSLSYQSLSRGAEEFAVYLKKALIRTRDNVFFQDPYISPLILGAMVLYIKMKEKWKYLHSSEKNKQIRHKVFELKDQKGDGNKPA